MKPLTASLMLSLAVAGTACSDPVSGPSKETRDDTQAVLTVDTETVTSETEIGGTLNLNLGGARDSGNRLIGSGGLSSGGNSGALIGSGGLGGGNFGSDPDLGINLDLGNGAITPLDQPAATGALEEDIVRLPD